MQNRFESESWPATDADLVGLIDSDVDAFDRLYRNTVRRVTGFAIHHLAGEVNALDVGEVVSRTYLKVLERSRTFDRNRIGDDPTPWIFSIALNEIRMMRRTERRHTKLARAASGRRPLGDDELADLEASIDAQRLAPALAKALAALTATERDAVLLIDGEGMSIQDAAHVLGALSPTVRARVSRGRRRLRSLMTSGTGPEPLAGLAWKGNVPHGIER